MGKSKKKKFGVSKSNPTGLQSVNEVEFELTANANSVPGALQDIIEKVSIQFKIIVCFFFVLFFLPSLGDAL